MKGITIEQCRQRGHAIFETINGLGWCRRCHENTDQGFAAHSHHLFKQIQKKALTGTDLISSYDMTKKTDENELYPSTYTISLGSTTMAQKRRAAYEKAAAKAGATSTAEWMRELLDNASDFSEEK